MTRKKRRFLTKIKNPLSEIFKVTFSIAFSKSILDIV